MNKYLYLLFVSIYYRDFAKIKILFLMPFDKNLSIFNKKNSEFFTWYFFIYLFIMNDS